MVREAERDKMGKFYNINIENIYLEDWDTLKYPENNSLRMDNGQLILDISQDDIRIGEAHIEVCLIEKGLVETIKKQMKELQDKLHRRNLLCNARAREIKELKEEIKKLINERSIYEKYVSPEQLSADDMEALENS